MTSFILEKIQLRNVRCYGDDIMEMDFPLNNLTVFTGHVGAGKSTIVKSVSMALYGDDGGVKGEKLTIDDMVNERTGKNLEIHLYFKSIDDRNNENHNYEIHLYHKHSSYGNKLVFMKDGKDISANGKLDTYRLIEKTLIPKQVYHNIYYFTQQAKNFFTALPNSEQKEIFNSILDLSEYDSYYENAKEKCDSLKNNLKDIINNITLLTNESNNIDSYIDSIYKKMDDEKNADSEKLSNLQNEKSLKYLEINNIKQSMSNFSSLDENRKKKEDITKEFYDTKQKFETLISDSLKSKNDLASDIKKQFELQKSNLNNQFLNDSSSINNLINEENDKKNNIQKEFLKNKLDLEKERIEKETEEKENFDKQCQDLNNQLISINERLEDLNENKINDLQELDEQYNITINDIIENLNKKKIEKTKIEASISQIKKFIEECKNNIDLYTNDLNSTSAVCRTCGQPLKNKDHIQKHINEFNKKLDEYNNQLEIEINELSNINQSIEYYNESKENETRNYDSQKTDIINNYLSRTTTIENDRNEIRNELFNKKKEFEDQVILLIRNNYKSKIDTLEKNMNDKIIEIENNLNLHNEKLNNMKKDLNEKLMSLKTRLENEYKEKTSNLDIDISKYKEQLKFVIDKYNEDILIINNIIEEIEGKLKSINDIEKLISNIDQSINDLKNKVYDTSMVDELLNKKNDTVKKLQKESIIQKDCEEDIEICEFWKQAFSDSGIKSMLIDSAIPHMNECVREELDRVAPGVFTVSFDTLSETKSGNIRDKFSINIINNMKGSTGHKKLSGGEKRIVDLCCMTALRSLAEKLYNKRFCHIFYDEILDSLDSECKEQFCRNVKHQSEHGLNITLITHDLPDDVEPDRVFPF